MPFPALLVWWPTARRLELENAPCDRFLASCLCAFRRETSLAKYFGSWKLVGVPGLEDCTRGFQSRMLTSATASHAPCRLISRQLRCVTHLPPLENVSKSPNMPHRSSKGSGPGANLREKRHSLEPEVVHEGAISSKRHNKTAEQTRNECNRRGHVVQVALDCSSKISLRTPGPD